MSNAIPACAIVAFVAMILACTSSQSVVDSSPRGTGGGANDSGSDGAMLTDSISTSVPFDDIASL